MTSPVVAQLGTLLSMPHISEKIATFVRNGKRHLFFVSPHTFEEWPRLDFPLTQIKIPLKPVGFFWTIRDNDGHEGILMGSMHITAEKLVNFPKRITELFDSSDAMAVEIDVTREDIVKRCSEEVSWEKTQAKELELLSTTEKEALFQFLKGQHPDLEVAPSDKFDPQTQFLIQALRKVALQGLKTNISGQKDKTTNQSFFSTGIEETLIRRAKEKQIPIRDLETFDDHFIKFSSGSSSFLPNISCEHMKKMIEMSRWSLEEALSAYCDHSDFPKINSRDDLWEYLQKHPLQKMTDTMESGDLDALEVSYLADRDPLSRANLIERNRNMAIKIDEFMRSGKKHFCIAGAMHMAGPSSIVAFLKQAGYKVERLIVEEPLAPVLDDDEKTPFVEDDEIESTFAGDLDMNLEDPMNPPVVSLDPSAPTQQTQSYWQTLPAQAISQVVNILSWPWRKFKEHTA
ncbi:MAG: TraB/GumN family protein [Candidatus Obscuribacterales bacterium]|nr:TraB/GumN family protein [Candidatus Obscuribacterales bacterium]